MMLKSFGCSFIYGTDLSDAGVDGTSIIPSQYTWPALLAKDLQFDYKSFARPGAGNLQILEKLLTHVATDTSSFYVIGWTWIDRFDYTTTDNLGTYNKAGADFWNTLMPTDDSDKAMTYYKNLHSQFRDKLSNLGCIKLAIDALKQNNCPFIMTYMDELIFETEWHVTPAIRYLQEYIQPSMTQFNGKNFLEFSKEKGFAISQTLHPLEAAHQAGFELIKSYNLV